MNKQLKSSLILLLVAVIWGFAFVAQVVGAEELSCMSYNGIRFTLGSISLIPVIMIFSRKKPEKKVARNTLIASVCGGIVLFIASDLQQWGVQFTETAGKAGFITGLYIVLVPIAQLILFRKSTPLTVWIGAVSAVCGLYLLSMTGAYKVELGDILLIIGAFFWTAHILIIDHFNETGVDALRLACGQFAVCGVLNLIGALIFEPLTITAVQSALLPLLYGGLMSVGVAYTLQIIGQRDAEPTTASIIMSLESLFSCVGGVLFLHEIMAPSNYIGCVLMLTGTVLAQIPGKKKS